MKEETTRRTKYTKEEKKMYKARMRRFKKREQAAGKRIYKLSCRIDRVGACGYHV